MTVLINYYTCSYGDSFVNMFNGNVPLRRNGIALNNWATFVEPDFYSQLPEIQKQIWQHCQQQNFKSVPCHRQQAFDFVTVFGADTKVITIELDEHGFLPDRFKKIHLDGRNKRIIHPILFRLLEAYPDKYQEIIAKDYEKWLAVNRLSNDIVFKFSWIDQPARVQEFCNDHALGFDNNWLENIKQDLKQYALLQH